MKLSSLATLPGTGGNGMASGNGGGGKRFRHPQGALRRLTKDETDVVVVRQAAGKLLGRIRRSIRAFSDNRQPRVFFAKYIIRLVP